MIADLLDKDLRTTVLKKHKELKEQVEKIKKSLNKIEISKEKENLKGNKKEILELKITVTEIRNSLGGFKQFSAAEESAKLKIGQCKIFSLRIRKEKKN